MRWWLVIPLYKWGHWSPERLNDVTKITQLELGKTGIYSRCSWPQTSVSIPDTLFLGSWTAPLIFPERARNVLQVSEFNIFRAGSRSILPNTAVTSHMWPLKLITTLKNSEFDPTVARTTVTVLNGHIWPGPFRTMQEQNLPRQKSLIGLLTLSPAFPHCQRLSEIRFAWSMRYWKERQEQGSWSCAKERASSERLERGKLKLTSYTE